MKKILLTLFVGLIGFINFGYCLDFYDPFELAGRNKLFTLTGIVNPTSSYTDINVSTPGDYCYVVGLHYVGSNDYWAGIDFTKSAYNGSNSFLVTNETMMSPGLIGCLPNLMGFEFDQGYKGNPYEYRINIYSMENPKICPTCDDPYTSLECQTEYNLIPVEDIDINYCVGNGFCPFETGTGDYTGDLQYSNIYINNILHPGRQNIFINIPDYITWDYSQNEVDFNVYVGSGYDVDYINSIVDINSYRPTSEDFTNVFVSGLTLVFPYIFVALLILFIWKLVKRIFK